MLKITKIVQCNLLFEYEGVKVLVDPGKYLVENYASIKNLSYLIITDVHVDHYFIEGIKTVLQNNPNLKVIVTESVKLKLEDDGLVDSCDLIVVQGDFELEIGSIKWLFGLEKHIPAYKDIIKTADILWYQAGNFYFGSGDTLALPKGRVKYMGQNVLAPFGSMEVFIDHTLRAKPERVFNIHDGYLNKDFAIGFYSFVKKYLEDNGIGYDLIQDGEVVSI